MDNELNTHYFINVIEKKMSIWDITNSLYSNKIIIRNLRHWIIYEFLFLTYLFIYLIVFYYSQHFIFYNR